MKLGIALLTLAALLSSPLIRAEVLVPGIEKARVHCFSRHNEIFVFEKSGNTLTVLKNTVKDALDVLTQNDTPSDPNQVGHPYEIVRTQPTFIEFEVDVFLRISGTARILLHEGTPEKFAITFDGQNSRSTETEPARTFFSKMKCLKE